MSQDQDLLPPEELPDRGPGIWERLGERARIETAFLWGFSKKWTLRGVFIALHLGLIFGGFYAIVWWASGGGCYSNVDRVPVRLVGVVLGCVKKVGAYDNEFFTTRVDAAAKLFHAGRVQYLLVTGDNSKRGYDEPTDLKAALVAKGVPANRIYCDYAGFRTLDSVIRVKKVFGQDDCTFVSQRFHNERAIYLARRNAMPDAVAFNADDVRLDSMTMMYIREMFARFKAVLDVEFLRTQPKYLGSRVMIGPKDPPVDAAPPPAPKSR